MSPEAVYRVFCLHIHSLFNVSNSDKNVIAIEGHLLIYWQQDAVCTISFLSKSSERHALCT